MDGIDFNATEDDTEDIKDNEDEDDGECQSFPHSSTTENDRPSTITEVILLLPFERNKILYYFSVLSRHEKLIKSMIGWKNQLHCS